MSRYAWPEKHFRLHQWSEQYIPMRATGGQYIIGVDPEFDDIREAEREAVEAIVRGHAQEEGA